MSGFFLELFLLSNTDALLSNATGTVKLKRTILITSEEIDEVIKKTSDWRPPGH